MMNQARRRSLLWPVLILAPVFCCVIPGGSAKAVAPAGVGRSDSAVPRVSGSRAQPSVRVGVADLRLASSRDSLQLHAFYDGSSKPGGHTPPGRVVQNQLQDFAGDTSADLESGIMAPKNGGSTGGETIPELDWQVWAEINATGSSAETGGSNPAPLVPAIAGEEVLQEPQATGGSTESSRSEISPAQSEPSVQIQPMVSNDTPEKKEVMGREVLLPAPQQGPTAEEEESSGQVEVAAPLGPSEGPSVSTPSEGSPIGMETESVPNPSEEMVGPSEEQVSQPQAISPAEVRTELAPSTQPQAGAPVEQLPKDPVPAEGKVPPSAPEAGGIPPGKTTPDSERIPAAAGEEGRVGPPPQISLPPAEKRETPGPPAKDLEVATHRDPGTESASVEEPRLVFNFKFQPWGQVLEWLAEKAGLSLVMEGPPHGTFNYSDRRAYTINEALDLINSVLLTKGYVLVRRGQMLILVNLADGVPPNLVPIVSEHELDKHAEHELVSTIFSLSRLSVEEGQQEIRSLLGPQGSVVTLPKAQQLLVTDTAGRLRLIRQVLARADSPEGGVIEAMQIFPLKYVTPDEAVLVLRQLLGIPADQFVAADGSLRLAVDTVGMRIFAAGRAARIRQVADILQAIDIPDSDTAAGRGVAGALQLEVYEVAPADPQTVLQVLQTLLVGSPGVRLTTDSKTGNLVALARPSEHATIRATVEQLRQQGTRLEVIPLRRLDPQMAAAAITKLLAGQDGAASVKVEVDSLSRQLLVRGTERELTLVKSLLEKMGEGSGSAQMASQGGTARVLPIYGTQAREIVERLQQIWPSLRGNSLRVIGTPSYIQSRTPTDRSQAVPPPGLPYGTLMPSGPPNPPVPGSQMYPGGQPGEWPEGGWPAPGVQTEQQWVPRDGGGQWRDPNSWGQPPVEMPQPWSPMPLGPPIDLQEWPVSPVPIPVAPQEVFDEARFNGNQGKDGVQFARVSRTGIMGREGPVDKTELPEAIFVSFQQLASPLSGAVDDGAPPPPPSEGQISGQVDQKDSARESRQPAPPVVIVPGPNGLVIASEDQEALDLVEELVRLISSQVGTGPQLTIFYLKHARAEALAEVLDQIFGGGTLAGSSAGGAGGMVRDLASAAFGEIGGGIVSSLLGGGGGTVTPSGTLRITPDARLNALIVQASPVDLEIIEQLLEVLDQKESPEEVLAQPRPRVVPVRNMQASEVAEIVRQVYQDRLVSAGSAQQGRGGPPNPQEFIQMLQALRGGRGGPTTRRSTLEQTQRLSLGVDTRTNSVIVAAPEPLFQEVKQLIEDLDAAAAKPPQATQVVVVRKTNPEAVQQAVRAMLGDSVSIGRSTPSGATVSGSTGTSGPSSSDRNRFWQRGGSTGGGFPGGTTPFFRPGFFGGFGFQGGAPMGAGAGPSRPSGTGTSGRR